MDGIAPGLQLGDTALLVIRSDGTELKVLGDGGMPSWSADGKQIATITGYGGDVYRVEVVGTDLWSCSADKTAKRHQLSDRKATADYKGHADYVFSLAVNAKTNRVASGCFDGEVKIWDVTDGKNVVSFKAAPGLVVAAAPPPASK